MDPNENQDPNALPENFFEQQDIDQEEAFMKQFESPSIDSMPGMSSPSLEDGFSDGADDADDDADDGADDASEVLEFDDTLQDDEKAELQELNEKLGTNFESLSELKKAYKKEDIVDRESEIQKDISDINYLNSLLDTNKYDNRKIVFEDKRLEYMQNKKDVTDPAVIEEINMEVDGMEESGALGYAAQVIRQNIKNALSAKQQKVDAYNNEKQASLEQTESEFKEGVQETINEVFKTGTYMGVAVTKEDMLDVYKTINKNKQLRNSFSSPREVVEFTLFQKYKDVLSKNLGQKSYKDGVKDTLEDIGLKGSKQTVNRSKNDQDDDNEKLSFLEAFAK